MVNPNTAWINERGTWLFYLAMLVLTRYSVFIFGIKTDAAWTSVLLGHSIITVGPRRDKTPLIPLLSSVPPPRTGKRIPSNTLSPADAPYCPIVLALPLEEGLSALVGGRRRKV